MTKSKLVVKIDACNANIETWRRLLNEAKKRNDVFMIRMCDKMLRNCHTELRLLTEELVSIKS